MTVSLAFVVLSITAPDQLHGSPITEDDGYTYPDDATEEEKEEIDEREQEAWEDAGRPGDNDNDNGATSSSNNGNDNDIPECQNGVTQECLVKFGNTVGTCNRNSADTGCTTNSY